MEKKYLVYPLLFLVFFLAFFNVQSTFAQTSTDDELEELEQQIEALKTQIKEETAKKQYKLQKEALLEEIQKLKDSLAVIQSNQVSDTSSTKIVTSDEESENEENAGVIIWPQLNSTDQVKTASDVSQESELHDTSSQNQTSDDENLISINPLNNLEVQEVSSDETEETNSIESEGSFGNSYGTTVTGDDAYYLISLEPEIELGRIGLGLDLDLRLSKDGELREEDWRDINDALRKIKYIEYHNLDETFNIRVGALSDITLGTGNLVYQYRNDASEDDSKTGLQLSYKTSVLKIEAFTSSLSEMEILAGRLELDPMNDIDQSIIKSFHMGITYAGDFSKYANTISSSTNDTSLSVFKKAFSTSENNFSAYSFDASLQLVNHPYLDLYCTSEATFLDGYGSGSSFGLELIIKDRSQEFTLDLNIQHINQGDQYESAYFGSFYEIERFSFKTDKEEWLETKANDLNQKTSEGNKYRTAFSIQYKQRFKFNLNFEKGYENVSDGLLNSSLRINDFLPQVNIEANYTKKNLNSADALSVLDENTLLSATVELELMENFTLSSDFQWTFTPDEIENNEVIRYKTQEIIEPRVNFSFDF